MSKRYKSDCVMEMCMIVYIMDVLVFYVKCRSAAIRIKKPIKTKFRLPIFNWTALKPNQINGTVFSEIDDERVLEVSLPVQGKPPFRGPSSDSFSLHFGPKLFRVMTRGQENRPARPSS